MITIVDYGLGNLRAFYNVYKKIGVPLRVASTPQELESASAIILPGVGSFDFAISQLNSSNLRDPLDHLVLNMRIPVLGVCVGMQIMANRSEEGSLPGLGWIPGEVLRFNSFTSSSPIRTPHMGWNSVINNPHPLFSNLTEPSFYFLHSYFFLPSSSEDTLAVSSYGHEFASAVCRNNVFGVQFHPEKSHHWGLELLANFSRISRSE